MSEYFVGQKVTLCSVNSRGDVEPEVEVTRVGRKLVYVRQHGRELAFRIDTGYRNDDYQHEWLETAETREARLRREAVEGRLRRHGISYAGYRGFSQGTETLERVADLLDEEEPND